MLLKINMKQITLLYLIETISFQPALPDGPACAHTLLVLQEEEDWRQLTLLK